MNSRCEIIRCQSQINPSISLFVGYINISASFVGRWVWSDTQFLRQPPPARLRQATTPVARSIDGAHCQRQDWPVGPFPYPDRNRGHDASLPSGTRAYNLQDPGHGTVTPEIPLGHGPGERKYDIARATLRDPGFGVGQPNCWRTKRGLSAREGGWWNGFRWCWDHRPFVNANMIWW
jgi:hypothetical protein